MSRINWGRAANGWIHKSKLSDGSWQLAEWYISQLSVTKLAQKKIEFQLKTFSQNQIMLAVCVFKKWHWWQWPKKENCIRLIMISEEKGKVFIKEPCHHDLAGPHSCDLKGGLNLACCSSMTNGRAVLRSPTNEEPGLRQTKPDSMVGPPATPRAGTHFDPLVLSWWQ